MANETKAQRVERIKREKDGLDVIEDIHRYAAGNIPVDDETIDRLKWYGMYLQRDEEDANEEQFFMLRVKLTNGELSKEQLKAILDISKNYARQTLNLTVRQDVQFHYIKIQDVPKVFELLHEVGLSSVMAAGDVPRNVVSCPLCDVSEDSIVNTKNVVRQINKMFEANKEFSNLPRKFKIGINGCKKHCIYHEIQDLGFTAFLHETGVLFDVTVGGGLSGGKQIAKRLGLACREEEIAKIAKATALIFKEHGNRENRAKARMRHLIDEWGVQKFTQELLGHTDIDFVTVDEPRITEKYSRNHIGIQKQQNGLYSIGCATNSGRLRAEGVQKILGILDTYGLDQIIITTTQDFIITGAAFADLVSIQNDLKPVFVANPTALQATTLACTGSEFCKFALTETKQFAKRLIDEINEQIPNCPIPVNIHIAGCNNSCSQPQVADIGLIATYVKDKEDKRVEGYEVFLGGYLRGEQSEFNKKIAVKLPVEKVGTYIINILKDYLEHYFALEDFHNYLRRQTKEVT